MAPKRKQATPKAKSGDKVKKQPKLPTTKASGRKRPLDEENDDNQVEVTMLGASEPLTARAKRQTQRRDTEEQVERVIKHQLKDFSIDTINATVNSDGTSVRKFLAGHIRERRSSNQYLTTKLWTRFFR